MYSIDKQMGKSDVAHENGKIYSTKYVCRYMGSHYTIGNRIK